MSGRCSSFAVASSNPKMHGIWHRNSGPRVDAIWHPIGNLRDCDKSPKVHDSSDDIQHPHGPFQRPTVVPSDNDAAVLFSSPSVYSDVKHIAPKVCGGLVQGGKVMSQLHFLKQPWAAWHLACQQLFLGLQEVPYRVLGGQDWGPVGGLPWADTILSLTMACSTPCRSAVQSQC